MNVDLSFIFLIWTHFLNQSRLLNLYPESVLLPVFPESKSIIPFWDNGLDRFDSEIILKIWKIDRVQFLIKIINICIILVGCIIKVSGGFLRIPRTLDWSAFCGPIRPPLKPPPWGDFFFPLYLFHAYIYHHALRTMHEISVREGLLT